MLAKTIVFRFLLAAGFLFFINVLFAQKTVSGKITDASGQPVAGSTISVRGSNVATQTNADGTFTITVPSANSRLMISSVGYEPQEIATAGKNSVVVSLNTTASTLNEVVVTGYTTQRKKDITGAVTVVNVADLKSQPAADATSQLQGRASGVTVVQSGVPGAAATVRIRGLGSFQNNSPLYVVDGVQTGSISGINPNDIESLQVLKDAASASIYGVRASNGVIIITTKKGRKKGVSVSYDAYYGFQDPGKGLDMLNAQEEADLYFIGQKNSGLPIPANSAYGTGSSPVLPNYIFATGAPAGPINTADPSKYSLDYNKLDGTYKPSIIVPANKAGTNWFDVITRNAPMQNHNLSMSGANDNSRFMLSLNYFDQDAITQYQFYKRYSIRLNSEFSLLKGVRVGENIQLYSSESNVPASTGGLFNNSEASVIAQTYRPMSIVPVYTINPGDFAGNLGNSGFGTWGNAKNPLADLYRRRNDRSNNINIFGNVYAEVDLFNHLTARSSFGGAINTNNTTSYPFIEYENNENVGNTTFNDRFTRNNNWIWTNQLTYRNTFGKHNISLLAGEEAQKGYGRQIQGASSSFFTYNYTPFINLANGSVQNLAGSQIFTPGTTVSYFAKADYVFNGKYILSATVRRDGSSKFLDKNKWATFPAFSAGWVVSEENFMKSMSWLNFLKIRGSWGKLGNEAAVTAANAYTTFGNNPTSSLYDINGTQTKPEAGFILSFIGNPLGKWEQSTTSNIGFDATIFHNSTEIVFDWYQKETTDLLYNPAGQAIGGAVGANNPSFRNVGSMKNNGIDLMITNRSNITRDLRLNTTLTFTTYNNKITAITQDGQPYFDFNSPANEANRIGANATRNFVGQPLNTFYGYKVIGLFQTAAEAIGWNQQDAAPGRFKYADINGDKKIDAGDRTVIGNPNPDFTYGLNLGLEYKNFDISTFFYGVAGKDAFNLTKWWTDFTPGIFPGGRSKRALYESWLPDGSRPNATTPIAEATGGGFSKNLAVNSYYVENASYFRLRNLQIGYTLPASIMNRIKLAKVRVYIQAANLFTITKYSGFNPEIVSSDERAASVDVGAYPTVRQYLVGLNVGF
ncbi:MAG: TonB-dependent receptor [Ginsengibacter sp.]